METIRGIPYRVLLVAGIISATSHSYAASIGDILEIWAQFYRLRWHPGVEKREEERLPEWCKRVFIPPDDGWIVGNSELVCKSKAEDPQETQ